MEDNTLLNEGGPLLFNAINSLQGVHWEKEVDQMETFEPNKANLFRIVLSKRGVTNPMQAAAGGSGKASLFDPQSFEIELHSMKVQKTGVADLSKH